MSGMYNMIMGRHPLAGVGMMILDLSPESVGRFRDCVFLRAEDGTPRIVILTRNGGGNREDHKEVFERLAKHPQYVRDWDDDFDNTYASIEFKVPPQHQKQANKAIQSIEEKAPELLMDPMKRFKQTINNIAE